MANKASNMANNIALKTTRGKGYLENWLIQIGNSVLKRRLELDLTMKYRLILQITHTMQKLQ
jgi:hypothetical protein